MIAAPLADPARRRASEPTSNRTADVCLVAVEDQMLCESSSGQSSRLHAAGQSRSPTDCRARNQCYNALNYLLMDEHVSNSVEVKRA
jgi:hypothetical protein